MVDEDKDGFLSLDDLAKFFKLIEDGQAEQTSLEDIGFTFRMLDVNNDGKLSFEELCGMFSLAQEAQSAKRVASSLTNSGGALTSSGQLKLERKLSRADSDEGLLAMFRAFDSDGNGKLDKKEVRRALKTWGQDVTEAELNDAWKTIDVGGDGFVSFDEFKTFMKGS